MEPALALGKWSTKTAHRCDGGGLSPPSTCIMSPGRASLHKRGVKHAGPFAISHYSTEMLIRGHRNWDRACYGQSKGGRITSAAPLSTIESMGLTSKAIAGAQSWMHCLLPRLLEGWGMGHPSREPPSPSCCLGILAGLGEAAGRSFASTKAANPTGTCTPRPWWSYQGCVPIPLPLPTWAEVPPCAHDTLAGIPDWVPQPCSNPQPGSVCRTHAQLHWSER